MDPELLKAMNELALTVGGFATGKPIVEKALTPTAEYIGQSLRGLVERFGNRNVLDVLRRTRQRLGEAVDEPGGVSPRVFKSLLEEASFCDDILTKEYFAAILAAARTPDGQDDSALQLVAIIRDMPVRQVRLHYVVYYIADRYLNGSLHAMAGSSERLEIPSEIVCHYASISKDRGLDISILGLIRQSLLADGSGRNFMSDYVRVIPSLLGIELFACVSDHSVEFVDEVDLSDLEHVPLGRCRIVREPPTSGPDEDEDDWFRESERDREERERREERYRQVRAEATALVRDAEDALTLFDAASIPLPPDLERNLSEALDTFYSDRYGYDRVLGQVEGSTPQERRARIEELRNKLEDAVQRHF